MTVQCCKCNRVRVGGRWSAASVAPLRVSISHTYCPRCLDECQIALFSDQASRCTIAGALFLSDTVPTFAIPNH
jgi:hypothetical protein